MTVEQFIVKNIPEHVRLDKYMSNYLPLKLSRAQVLQLIKEKKVHVNNVFKKASYIVQEGDKITFLDSIMTEHSDYKLLAEDIAVDIIYEDDDLVIINKPQGMVVHPAPGNYTGTLVNALLFHFQNLANKDKENVRPGIVHRIDKDTSGLLMVAKNNYSHDILVKQLQAKTIVRKYQTLLHGVFPHASATIDAPIGRSLTDRKKMAITAKNSKKAVTHLRVLCRYDAYTYVECQLETGRTHQIRVHMHHIGHPVVGDPKYGIKKNIVVDGQLLHAGMLGLVHPRTNKYMEFSVPIPKKFQLFLEALV